MDMNTFLKFLAVMILLVLCGYFNGKAGSIVFQLLTALVCLFCIVTGVLMILGLVH